MIQPFLESVLLSYELMHEPMVRLTLIKLCLSLGIVKQRKKAQQPGARPVIPWQTITSTPMSEFTNPYFFTLSFPCSFLYQKGNFHINRKGTSSALYEWTYHLLWY